MYKKPCSLVCLVVSPSITWILQHKQKMTCRQLTDDEMLIVHRLVYGNNHEALGNLLSQQIDQQLLFQMTNGVFRGQTPLTLAITLGHTQCIEILLNRDRALALVRNHSQWSPYQEATSLGNRDIMEMLIAHRNTQITAWFEDKGRSILYDWTHNIPDFELELGWNFTSWIPFLSNICPSDTYRIRKSGACLRIDTTLVGFENLSWVRGNVSLMVNAEPPQNMRVILCDHDRKIVEQLYPRTTEISPEMIQEEISLSLNSKIDGFHAFDLTNCTVARQQSGIWPFSAPKTEHVGHYPTAVYSVDNMNLVWKQRVEHLSARQKEEEQSQALDQLESELTKKKWVINNPDENGIDENCDTQDLDEELLRILNEEEDAAASDSNDIGDACAKMEDEDLTFAEKMVKQLSKFVPSLLAPRVHLPPADDYFDPILGHLPLHLGRTMELEESVRSLKATVWMTEPSMTTSSTHTLHHFPNIHTCHFPFNLEDFHPLFELIGIAQPHLEALEEFFRIRLPPGFPIQIEIPLVAYALSVRLTFQNLVVSPALDASIFHVPGKAEGYRSGEILVSRFDFPSHS